MLQRLTSIRPTNAGIRIDCRTLTATALQDRCLEVKRKLSVDAAL